MEIGFSEWLQGQLNQREWSQADLARHSDITQTHISRIMGGMRNPGPNALRKIARALRLPAEEVYRNAGLLPPKGMILPREDRQMLAETIEKIKQLSPENQRLLFDIVDRIRRSERVPPDE